MEKEFLAKMEKLIDSCVKKIIEGHHSDGKCWHNEGLVVYTFSKEKPTVPYETIDTLLRPVINSESPKKALQKIIELHEMFNRGKIGGYDLGPYNDFGINASTPGCLQTIQLNFCHTIYAFFKDPLVGKKIGDLVKGDETSETHASRINVDGNSYVVLKSLSGSREIYFDFLGSPEKWNKTYTYRYLPCTDI